MGRSVQRSRGRLKRGRRRRKGREKRDARLIWRRGVVVRAKRMSEEMCRHT
jgi:hypothetical protein